MSGNSQTPAGAEHSPTQSAGQRTLSVERLVSLAADDDADADHEASYGEIVAVTSVPGGAVEVLEPSASIGDCDGADSADYEAILVMGDYFFDLETSDVVQFVGLERRETRNGYGYRTGATGLFAVLRYAHHEPGPSLVADGPLDRETRMRLLQFIERTVANDFPTAAPGADDRVWRLPWRFVPPGSVSPPAYQLVEGDAVDEQ